MEPLRATQIVLQAVLLVAVCVAGCESVSVPADSSAPRAGAPAHPAYAGADAVVEAFRARRSDLPVEVTGTVRRILPDDRDGSRHQRFIMSLANDHTLLIAHNIDLAPRVPVDQGDMVTLRGEYEWNERGGVVHWTHDDPDGTHPGGWILHDGRQYR